MVIRRMVAINNIVNMLSRLIYKYNIKKKMLNNLIKILAKINSSIENNLEVLAPFLGLLVYVSYEYLTYSGEVDLIYHIFSIVYLYFLFYGLTSISYNWFVIKYSDNIVLRVIERFSMLHIYLLIIIIFVGLASYLLINFL